MGRLSKEIERLEERKQELEEGIKRGQFEVTQVVEALDKLATLVASTDIETKKRMLRSVFERVEVAGGKVTGWAARGWCRPFFVS